MKIIKIKATQFFELLKIKDASMWEIFAQMIDGEEKKLIFVNDDEQVLFDYILPKTLAQLNGDRTEFSKEYSAKLSGLN